MGEPRAPPLPDRASDPPSPSPAGPVNIHERVQRAMAIPGQNHRDPSFAPFFLKCLDDAKWLFM